MPGAAPQNVRTFVFSSTEILVFWNVVPELDQNGLIINCEVQLEPLDFTADIFVDSLNTTDLRLLELATDLEEFVNYNFRVRTYTSVGPGPYSDPMTARTLEDGNVPIYCPLINFVFPQYKHRYLILSTSRASSECPSHSCLLH